MRLLAFIAVAALLNTCTSAGGAAEAGPVEVRVAGSGAYAEGSTERNAIAVFDSADYERRIEALLGSGEIPPVDFSTEAAVILLAGQRSTGGYSIAVRGARVEGDTIIVDAVVQGPPPGSAVTQAITSPWTVVAVRNRSFKNVQWPR